MWIYLAMKSPCSWFQVVCSRFGDGKKSGKAGRRKSRNSFAISSYKNGCGGVYTIILSIPCALYGGILYDLSSYERTSVERRLLDAAINEKRGFRNTPIKVPLHILTLRTTLVGYSKRASDLRYFCVLSRAAEHAGANL